ncbi:MAG: sodium/pantothenate symporter, partial [Eggerthellaceae bacterium]|nr:sodium/pantothenate symporter [Eggerthellaceae bacterium]
MTWTGLIPVVVFLIAAVAISVAVRKASLARISGNTRFVDEYFLGNRSLGGFVLAMTCVATYGSVSSFVGGPGQAWSIGFGWVYMATVQVTALILLYGIMGKKMALVSRKTGAVTVVDVIRKRYNSQTLAILGAVIIIVFFATTMVAQFVGGAKLFEAVTGYSYTTGLLIFGASAILFTTIGGFKGVSITDALCGIAMLIGLVILAWGILSAGGGLENIMATIQTNHPQMMEPLSGGDMPIGLYVTQWLLVGLLTFALPQSSVRCMGARSTGSFKRAMVIGTVIIGIMMIVSTSMGVLAAGVLTDDIAAYGGIDNIIPLAIVQTLPPVAAGIAIVGPIAASISTVSSLLISSSSAIIKDLFLGFKKDREQDGSEKTSVAV